MGKLIQIDTPMINIVSIVQLGLRHERRNNQENKRKNRNWEEKETKNMKKATKRIGKCMILQYFRSTKSK